MGAAPGVATASTMRPPHARAGAFPTPPSDLRAWCSRTAKRIRPSTQRLPTGSSMAGRAPAPLRVRRFRHALASRGLVSFRQRAARAGGPRLSPREPSAGRRRRRGSLDAKRAWMVYSADSLEKEGLVVTLRDAVDLANMRYQGGSPDLEVLDVETRLITAELDLVLANLNERTAVIQLYRALGGGWKQQAPQAPRRPCGRRHDADHRGCGGTRVAKGPLVRRAISTTGSSATD
jgi:hypothetical protein